MFKKILAAFLFSLSTQAATVLFIGDSHSVGPFGWKMDENLRSAGNTVATYASCGSIPRWWSSGQKTTCGYFSRDIKGKKTEATIYQTPLITDLLNETRPDVVIMEFGGNYANTPSDAFVINDIKNIVKIIKDSGAACFWITNPDTRKNRGHIPRILKLIKEGVEDNCPIFDSSKVTRYPETGGDGVHYWNTLGTPIARSWADKAYANFIEHWNQQ